MSRNHNFFFDKDGTPRARGPVAEKTLMNFLEQDVQGSDHICRDLMDDLTAIEDETDESREFIGNAHCITFSPTGVSIAINEPAEVLTEGEHTHSETTYQVGLKHFREILEDWEAFILDDQIDNSLGEDEYT